MMPAGRPAIPEIEPKLDQNILLFVRLLRVIGLKVGPSSVIDAVEAVQLTGLADKRILFHCLSSCLVKNPQDRMLFEQAFTLFWQNPKFQERMRDLLIPQFKHPHHTDEQTLSQRLEDALGSSDIPDRQSETDVIEIDASGTVSDTELFQQKDFRMMTMAEVEQAVQVIRALRLHLPSKPSRRFKVDRTGPHLDMRKSLRRAAQTFGTVLPHFKIRASQDRPIIVMLDISGSMDSYTRMMLHFMHVLTAQHRQVTCFIFGTHLTNITHQLKTRDIDEALGAVANAADDWSGGTRIAKNIEDFNKYWSRRVASGNPIILLITDGLEKLHDERLSYQMERLHKSCQSLIWLNPLLRFSDFRPKSLSIRRIIEHVDALLPIHSLSSMTDLVAGLSVIAQSRDPHILTWQAQARATDSSGYSTSKSTASD